MKKKSAHIKRHGQNCSEMEKTASDEMIFWADYLFFCSL
ncbi:hypothetical protein BRO54_1188 [Geobacillus proteiniphilus]|uniref:Uncharacterized protein n=1 Tax=Geobacillus proteiniphilus TaxID=860353 RepID=A0A1Q5T4M1_9BACL|nr:hypothetical protein BRO54_1188 [Geobacillus proteiniphilus]